MKKKHFKYVINEQESQIRDLKSCNDLLTESVRNNIEEDNRVESAEASANDWKRKFVNATLQYTELQESSKPASPARLSQVARNLGIGRSEVVRILFGDDPTEAEQSPNLKIPVEQVGYLMGYLEGSSTDFVSLEEDKVEKEVCGWRKMDKMPIEAEGAPYFSKTVELLTVGGSVIRGFFYLVDEPSSDITKGQLTIYLSDDDFDTSVDENPNQFQKWRYIKEGDEEKS